MIIHRFYYYYYKINVYLIQFWFQMNFQNSKYENHKMFINV